MTRMSESTKTRLFFFKANPSDLRAVEAYLSKRNFEVMSETNFNDALAKIIHFDPAYIFLAWDHPHPRIQAIPKFLGQTLPATVIPYIESTSRDQLRSLEASGFSLKIFPPVSGPAIIRTVLKIEKDQQIDVDLKIKSAKAEKQAAAIIITNKNKIEAARTFLKDLEKQPLENESNIGFNSTPAEKSFIHIQKGNRGELIKYNKSKLENFSKSNIAEKLKPEMKQALQEEFQTKIKNQIIDLNQTYDENEFLHTTEAAEDSKLTFQKLLCLIVQSESWCGYLVIASKNQIKSSDYQNILQNWLQDQFINMNEVSENDYFEIELQQKDIDLKSWAKANSDYLEIIENELSEVLISFFSIDPKYLILELSEAHQMLEIALEIIPTETKVTLSLFLHLPDNKKYILYTPALQALSGQQKAKLQEKNIDRLFTPLSFEKELNKLKAEHYLNETVKKIKQAST